MSKDSYQHNILGNFSHSPSLLIIPPRRYWLFLLLLFPILTIFGNLLVVLSVSKERSLRNATNYFIVSLALADISLAVMVMPYCVWLEVTSGYWAYAELLCDIFIMLDVMFSTASIMNLAAISVDRYFAVTQPLKYSRHNNFSRVYVTIAITWIVSFFIALPVACGLNNTSKRHPNECRFNNSNFIILSSLGSFYIPAVILLILYYRIFKVIQIRAKRSAEINRGKTIYNTISNCDNKIPLTDSDTKEANHNNGDDGLQDQRNNHVKFISKISSSLKNDKYFNCKETSDGLRTLSSYQSSSSTNTSDVFVGTIVFGAAHLTLNPIIIPKLENNIKRNISFIETHNKTNQVPMEFDSDHDSSTALSNEEGFLPEYKERIAQEKHKLALSLSSNCQPNGKFFDSRLGMQKFRLYQKYRLQLVKKGIPFDQVHNIALGKVKDLESRFWTFLPLRGSQQKAKYNNIQRFNRKTFSQSLKMMSFKSMRRRKSCEKSSAKRERKATKTLVIVLVIFLVCWVPFFTLNVTQAFCLKFDSSSHPSFICTLNSSNVGSVTVWLGYINSFLNPIIYTIFNIEFRRAFKKLLHLK